MIRADNAMPSGALDRQFCPMASCAAYNVPMSLTQSRFAVGQLVRFIAPLNEDEREEQFTVLELRGERVLVEFVCGMSIRPTFVYLAADLVPVDGWATGGDPDSWISLVRLQATGTSRLAG